MNKKTLMLSLSGALLLMYSGHALAQYTGPSNTKPSTVAAVLESAKDNAYVQLSGKITKQVGNEKYTFADSTGEIRVEIDNEVFSVPVDDKTMVEIRGEYEKILCSLQKLMWISIIVKK